MSTPFRGRYSPASRGGGAAAGAGGARGGGMGRGGGGGGGGGDFRGGYRGSNQQQYGRGGGGGSRGSGGRGGGGDRGGHRGGHGGGGDEKPRKESILNLEQYLNREIYVKFTGGREVSGTLKGFDPLLNMVLDDAQEKMRNAEGEVKARSLGLAVIRGTHITTLHPVEGSESISNPYLAVAAEHGDTAATAAAGDGDGDDDNTTGKAKVTPAYQFNPKPDSDSD